MYLVGENFYHNIEGVDIELSVLENLLIKDKEYLITEDLHGHNFIFFSDEDCLFLIEEKTEINDVLYYWKKEYLGHDDIGDWDNEYYDRNDSEYNEQYYDDFDNYNYEREY